MFPSNERQRHLLRESAHGTMADVYRFVGWYGDNKGHTTGWDDTRYEQATKILAAGTPPELTPATLAKLRNLKLPELDMAGKSIVDAQTLEPYAVVCDDQQEFGELVVLVLNHLSVLLAAGVDSPKGEH